MYGKYLVYYYFILQFTYVKCTTTTNLRKSIYLGNATEEKNIRKTQLIVEDMVRGSGVSKLKKDKNARIVGGQETDIQEYPFVVSLQYASFDLFQHYCGGSVLNERCILTAAHCTYANTKPLRPKNIHILSAKTKSKLWVLLGLFQTNQVKTYINHPDYAILDKTVVNDISILILKNKLRHYKQNVFPIKLATPALFKQKEPWDYFQTRCKTLGWGTSSYKGEVTKKLNVVDLPLISNDDCKEYNTTLSSNGQICTLATEGGKDACQGDSGGPLICTANETFQVGIVSFGKGCGSPMHPGVWTRIDKYIDWIENVTKTYSGSDKKSKNACLFNLLIVFILFNVINVFLNKTF